MKINTGWFHDLITQSSYGSLRRLASKMEIDHATLSRMLTGERKMTFQDARELAKRLRVSVIEIFIQAGAVRADEVEEWVESQVDLTRTSTHERRA